MPPRRMEMNKLNIIIKMESNTIIDNQDEGGDNNG